MVEFPPEKLLAIEALALGESDQNAASIAGVHRVTVYRWRHDPEFVAALNRRVAQLIEELSCRKRGIYSRALDLIGHAIEDGDVKAALQFARLAEPGALRSPGPITGGGVLASKALAFQKDEQLSCLVPRKALAEALVRLIYEGEQQPGGLSKESVDILVGRPRRTADVTKSAPSWPEEGEAEEGSDLMG